jgi:hypothetical protein
MLIVRHHHELGRAISWWFAAALAVGLLETQIHLSLGLYIVGILLVAAALLVEARSKSIWDDYRRRYRYRKGSRFPEFWTQPRRIYYLLNVWVVWPLVALTGIAAIVAGWYLGS